MNKIRVLVVDDHTVVRDGICALLALADDIEVVAIAADGKEALKLVNEMEPAVVLMDIAMPVMGGLEATRQICRKYPRAKVLILTQYDDKEYVIPVIEVVATGFISKIAAFSELVAGIRSVYRGDSYLSPSVAKLLVEDYRLGKSSRVGADSYKRLTGRERDMLKLVAEGHTTREIAEVLMLSSKTVEGHKCHLMVKLDIHNRTELIKYALRKGIIII